MREGQHLSVCAGWSSETLVAPPTPISHRRTKCSPLMIRSRLPASQDKRVRHNAWDATVFFMGHEGAGPFHRVGPFKKKHHLSLPRAYTRPYCDTWGHILSVSNVQPSNLSRDSPQGFGSLFGRESEGSETTGAARLLLSACEGPGKGRGHISLLIVGWAGRFSVGTSSDATGGREGGRAVEVEREKE